MTLTTKKIPPSPRKNILAKRWILIIILLVLATVTATGTAYATPTSTSNSTATKTTAPSSTSETTVKVSGYFVNLRTGPGSNFAAVRKLTFGELLILLGRLSDNTWLYVKTSDGQEGWIITTWVDLAGINVDYLPVKTSPPAEIPTTVAKVSGDSVNLRTGPGANFAKVRKLTFDELLILLGRLSDNTWLYVKTSDGQEGWINTTWVDLAGIYVYSLPVKKSPPPEIPTPVALVGIEGHWIDINLTYQMLYAFDGTDLVGSFLVSTGTYLYPTEYGQYHIYVKRRYTLMHGADYFLPNVPYSMFYNKDFSIHGTYWHHNFGTPMSHGCVNMDTKDAEWLYNWASVGTFVNIHY